MILFWYISIIDEKDLEILLFILCDWNISDKANWLTWIIILLLSNDNGNKVIGKDDKGRELYQGVKGGVYYLTKSGKKAYVKRKDDQKQNVEISKPERRKQVNELKESNCWVAVIVWVIISIFNSS